MAFCAACTNSRQRKQEIQAEGATLRQRLHPARSPASARYFGREIRRSRDVWSVTSYKALYTDAVETERWNRLHPSEKARVPYVTETLADAPGALVAATDYIKTLPSMISKWMPRRMPR